MLLIIVMIPSWFCPYWAAAVSRHFSVCAFSCNNQLYYIVIVECMLYHNHLHIQVNSHACTCACLIPMET